MKLPNGIVTEKEVILSADWSRNQIDVWVGKKPGKPLKHYVFNDLLEVAKAFPNSILFIESTALSFELDLRAGVIAAFKEYNVNAYHFKPRRTAHYRKKYNVPKGNKEDARCIFMLGTTDPRTVAKFKELTKDELGDRIQNVLVQDRSNKSIMTQNLAQQYIDFFNVPVEYRPFLWDSKAKKPKKAKFKACIGRFVYLALELRNEAAKTGKKGGRRTFEKMVGDFGLGYGRFLRSEFYHWFVKPVAEARFKVAGLKAKDSKNTWYEKLLPKQKEIQHQTLKDARKCLLWLRKETVSKNLPATVEEKTVEKITVSKNPPARRKTAAKRSAVPKPVQGTLFENLA